MAGFQCPFCQMVMSESYNTVSQRFPSFDDPDDSLTRNHSFSESTLYLKFYQCPNCGNYTIHAKGKGAKVLNVNTYLHPQSLAKIFPDYIPETVRNDYEEACAIVNLSPKASATLSRRCLQGMIRDFWGISKSRLVDEINALESLVPAAQWKVLNSLRRIGNIGAHPEADANLIIDIEPKDAQKMIAVIELLMKQWYIERHEEELLYDDIIAFDEDAQSQKTKE